MKGVYEAFVGQGQQLPMPLFPDGLILTSLIARAFRSQSFLNRVGSKGKSNLGQLSSQYASDSLGVSNPRFLARLLSASQVRDELLRRTGERRGRHEAVQLPGRRRRNGEKEKRRNPPGPANHTTPTPLNRSAQDSVYAPSLKKSGS